MMETKDKNAVKITRMTPEAEIRIWKDAVAKLMRVRRIGRNGQPILLRRREVA